ncbi:hypothetical protein [Alkalibacillus aidingensis]|uniref:hypothetical protein n=1 Tax=Alkalibacillus aidingensis TaxID=2747607 RepID=UPI001660A736|nr:hypothetical protein [Alkalibacillus aidingensis]
MYKFKFIFIVMLMFLVMFAAACSDDETVVDEVDNDEDIEEVEEEPKEEESSEEEDETVENKENNDMEEEETVEEESDLTEDEQRINEILEEFVEENEDDTVMVEAKYPIDFDDDWNVTEWSERGERGILTVGEFKNNLDDETNEYIEWFEEKIVGDKVSSDTEYQNSAAEEFKRWVIHDWMEFNGRSNTGHDKKTPLSFRKSTIDLVVENFSSYERPLDDFFMEDSPFRPRYEFANQELEEVFELIDFYEPPQFIEDLAKGV